MRSYIQVSACLMSALLCMSTSGSAADGKLNPYAYPQPDSVPNELIALIEIPQGSINKYEIDAATGLRVLSRVISMPVVYPVNYGAFPGTLAGDGDALDALVLAREPIVSGTLVRVRPIGVLRMVDGGKADEKIVCVPAGDVDPTFADVQTLQDLPKIELDRIESFFRVYKDLPEGRKTVVLDGFGSVEEAGDLILNALKSDPT